MKHLLFSPAESNQCLLFLIEHFFQVMANLNFQQAPRSLGSGGIGGRVSSGLVGGVSGHVTPTFGGALSPSRNTTAMPGAPPSMASRSTLFGQRAFADRRVPMPTTLSQPNSNSMVRPLLLILIRWLENTRNVQQCCKAMVYTYCRPIPRIPDQNIIVQQCYQVGKLGKQVGKDKASLLRIKSKVLTKQTKVSIQKSI